jgi:hypothetical protein
MTAIYRTKGVLTGTIESENVAAAQDYLTNDDMTQYLDQPLRDAVALVRWNLNSDGHTYYVEAICHRELNDDELKELAEWTSGQNSDGLGEGFEQQDFAWVDDSYDDDDEYESGSMVSFDWKTNDSTYERVV